MKIANFALKMGYLQKYFGRKLDKEIYAMYQNRLLEIPEDKFDLAIKNLIEEFDPTSTKPFPLIKDILFHCGESSSSKAKNIVMAVKMAVSRVGRYSSIDFGDSAIHAVIERWGGWPRICDWTEKDWQINQKRFEEDFEAAKMSGISGPQYLLGVFEISNNTNGHQKFVSENQKPKLVYQNEKGILAIGKSKKTYQLEFTERNISDDTN